MKRFFNATHVAVVLIATGFALPAPAEVSLVRDGRATAVVVTADEPTPTAKYAAEELVRHVEKASGVRLAIVTESDVPADAKSRVYVGATGAARRHGIDIDGLLREAFVLRSVGGNLLIAGREDENDPLDPGNPNAGTLFGVYEFLEESLGVRWLWPGELGAYVPRAETIEFATVDRMETPALRFRELAWGRMRSVLRGGKVAEEDARLGFSPEVAREYAEALSVLLRRHRMGGMDAKPPTGHAFSGWWQRYGKEHPEWFMLRRDGVRGDPDPKAEHVDVCVTNKELQDFIVARWDGESVLRLGPVDRPGRCMCDDCRAWDGPQPETVPWFAEMVYETDPRAANVFAGVTSDRYARFWKVIQEKARKRNPDVVVSGSFIYENEFPAPVTGIELNQNIYAEFVQWQDPHLRWFPMPDEAYAWVKEQWLGWQRTGLRMGYRPNYLHDGYVMPHFETRQSGEFLKFAYEHGMEGARFDSLTGQWAVHGPRLYMHLRLLNKPDLELDAIRREYFEAFGPAAGAVECYCDYWEDYAVANTMRFIEWFGDSHAWMRYRSYPLHAHQAFPPAVFAPAAALLDEALVEARKDPLPEYAQRVEFLRLGLEHAQLTVRLASLFDGNRNVAPDRRDDAKKALAELVQFRKEHERQYFSDLLWVANFWERPRLNVDALWESR
ncbi:MAG: DUF4838 domain-containing protein [Thermoguttaceae bacterium]|jgi:hypothetical protein|nr:DUF4838 domain-containing protein [Thermoguttaceae bacterium]